MRANPEPIGYYTRVPRPAVVQPSYAPPTVLVVIPETDRGLYAGNQIRRVYAHSAEDAARLVAISRPRIVVIDWDQPSLGGADICASIRAAGQMSVLVTTGDVRSVPAILRAGCHGVLLKPFAPNLLAARLGRVIKETERPSTQRPLQPGSQTGTNRVWPDSACPKCGVRGATSFDFSSYRRMWYACLSCDYTWLAPRQE